MKIIVHYNTASRTNSIKITQKSSLNTEHINIMTIMNIIKIMRT